MSAKHPIIAITGSSGAGTTTVRHTSLQTLYSVSLIRFALKPVHSR